MNSKRRNELDEARIALSDRQAGLSRRGQALLAAAGMDAPYRRWFVLRVDRRAEGDVVAALEAAGVEVWLPTKVETVQVRHTSRRIERAVPIFDGYVFVRVAPVPASWAGLGGVDGVAGILGGEIDGEPVAVPDAEMDMLCGLIDTGFFEQKPDDKPFRIGSTVRIVGGPFAHFRGVLDGYVGETAVRVMASLFGREVPVTLKLAQIGESH